MCKDEENCVLVLMVQGNSKDITSRYRLKVFRGQNKLYEHNAYYDLVQPGEFKY